MRLFVDTGALMALGSRRDSLHARAVEFLRAMPPETRLSTNNLVFTETVTLIAARYGQDAAVRFADGFLGSRIWSVVHYADEALDRASIAIMRRFHDKTLSFTDASVIATVKAEGLDGVFGFDEDFRRCGVALYP
ncbi:MAG: PIN domain-containing protein [Elusimicrobia bacterium]|nr:PIN domain-containing protein [Elusimicrobiota bacterium]